MRTPEIRNTGIIDRLLSHKGVLALILTTGMASACGGSASPSSPRSFSTIPAVEGTTPIESPATVFHVVHGTLPTETKGNQSEKISYQIFNNGEVQVQGQYFVGSSMVGASEFNFDCEDGKIFIDTDNPGTVLAEDKSATSVPEGIVVQDKTGICTDGELIDPSALMNLVRQLDPALDLEN